MNAYYIEYTLKGEKKNIMIDAKNLTSAKRKIGKKHGYKDGRMIKPTTVSVIGYY